MGTLRASHPCYPNSHSGNPRNLAASRVDRGFAVKRRRHSPSATQRDRSCAHPAALAPAFRRGAASASGTREPGTRSESARKERRIRTLRQLRLRSRGKK